MKKFRGYMTSLMAESGAQIISTGHFLHLLCLCFLLGWFYSEIGKYGHKQFQVFILLDLHQTFFFFFGRASLRYIKWFTHLKFTHLKFTHLYKPIVFGYIQRVIQPSSQTVWNIFITSKQNPMSFRSHSPFSHNSYPPVPDNHQSTFCFYCFDYHGHVI